jgi:hypothetical protein
MKPPSSERYVSCVREQVSNCSSHPCKSIASPRTSPSCPISPYTDDERSSIQYNIRLQSVYREQFPSKPLALQPPCEPQMAFLLSLTLTSTLTPCFSDSPALAFASASAAFFALLAWTLATLGDPCKT